MASPKTLLSLLNSVPSLIPNADSEGHFQAYFSPPTMDKSTAFALKVSPYMRSRKILTAHNLNDAVRGCDTFAKAKVVFGSMALGCDFILSPVLKLNSRISAVFFAQHAGGMPLRRSNRKNS
jgi:hypothetical protein